MLWDFFFKLVTYPIQWFWKQYQNCKENGDVKKMVLLWLLSLTGIIAVGVSMFFATAYILTNHMDKLIILCLVLWLYAYVRDKYCIKQENPAPQIEKNLQQLQEQAEKGYPVMRNIVYQTAKAIAPDIGGKIPRLLGEIEMPEGHYILANDICFYQFRLAKADMRNMYTQADLKEFKNVIQSALSDKIRSGEFPTLKIEDYRDKYGNWQDAVIVDTVEDIGNCFVIQTVFCTPEYSDYAHQVRMNWDASDGDKTSLEVQWKDVQ